MPKAFCFGVTISSTRKLTLLKENCHLWSLVETSIFKGKKVRNEKNSTKNRSIKDVYILYLVINILVLLSFLCIDYKKMLYIR